jgi:hypothetical protein
MTRTLLATSLFCIFYALGAMAETKSQLVDARVQCLDGAGKPIFDSFDMQDWRLDPSAHGDRGARWTTVRLLRFDPNGLETGSKNSFHISGRVLINEYFSDGRSLNENPEWGLAPSDVPENISRNNHGQLTYNVRLGSEMTLICASGKIEYYEKKWKLGATPLAGHKLFP